MILVYLFRPKISVKVVPLFPARKKYNAPKTLIKILVVLGAIKFSLHLSNTQYKIHAKRLLILPVLLMNRFNILT
jgi:hypothetical protein